MFCVVVAFCLLLSLSAATAVSFELMAVHENGYTVKQNTKCFTMYFGKDALVRGVIQAPPASGQHLYVTVKDGDQNMVYSKNNVEGEHKMVFTTHSYNDYETCFVNYLDAQFTQQPAYQRSVTFEMDYSSEFDDSLASTIKDQKIKPIEAELKSLESVMEDIVDEMEYLKQREADMRDTNESTNDRVQWFSVLSILTLVSSGVWQVWYLRKFFESKKIL